MKKKLTQLQIITTTTAKATPEGKKLNFELGHEEGEEAKISPLLCSDQAHKMLMLSRGISEVDSNGSDEVSDSDSEYEIAPHDIVPEITLIAGNYGPKVALNPTKTTTNSTFTSKKKNKIVTEPLKL